MSRNMRAAVAQAQFNEGVAGFVVLEILLAAAAVGYWQDSWWIGGGLAFALLIFMWVPAIYWPLALAASVGWGFLTGALARHLELGSGADWIIGIFVFLVALGTHSAALQYAQDISGQTDNLTNDEAK